MTASDERPFITTPTTVQLAEPPPVPGMVSGPGHSFPSTAPGVPLSAFAFAFAVGFLGLVKTGILSSAANDMFIAVAFGIGSVGLLVGGLWEFRGGELFGGTFGVGYAGFLFSTGMILKFFAPAIIASAGPLAFGDAFSAWLIMWALFTAVFAIGARSISLAALAPFALAFVVLIVLAIAGLGGTASWVSGLTRFGGWVAILDGFAAGYLASGILLNTTLCRDVVPLWPAEPRG
jgi:succinate-acetate transporter protein